MNAVSGQQVTDARDGDTAVLAKLVPSEGHFLPVT